MSHNVQCEGCGGNDFRLENGFYFCSECHLQSQDIQEHVLDDYYGGQSTVASKVKTDTSKQTHPEEALGLKIVSSVELLNFILKGVVDELIALGAHQKLRIITLQLWASYLRKIRVAFISKSTSRKKPKMSMWSRPSDVTRLYKVRKVASMKYFSIVNSKKRKRGSSKKTNSDLTPAGSVSHIGIKRRLTAKKASLARAEYDESMNLSQAPSLHSDDISNSSQSEADERVQYSKESKKEVEDLAKQLTDYDGDKISLLRKMNRKYRRSIWHPRIAHLFFILRIALILSGSDIHIGDLFRWVEEGYLSILSGRKFIPEGITLTSDQKMMLSKGEDTQNSRNIMRYTKRMVDFLGVTNIGCSPGKIISTLVRRYCRVLNLPDTVFIGIDGLLRLKPPTVWLNYENSNFEGRAMALILFSLKILIGLDDVTELNYVPRKGVEGVKWEDWCRQYEAKIAKKAVHHHPTLVRHYLNSYIGRNQSFLSHWDPSTNYLRHGNRTGRTVRSMMECFTRALKPLACKVDEPSWRPGLEVEDKSIGPPLAVLSERVNGTCRKGPRNIILEKPIPQLNEPLYKNIPKDALKLKVRVLNDDAEVRATRTREPSEGGEKILAKITSNEDYSVWIHHHPPILRPREFARFASEKFPRSFWWLLQQTAEIIYQSPFDLYEELITVERVYSNKNRQFSRSW